MITFDKLGLKTMLQISPVMTIKETLSVLENNEILGISSHFDSNRIIGIIG